MRGGGMFSDRETALFASYNASYDLADSDVMRRIETDVCGCDFFRAHQTPVFRSIRPQIRWR